MAEGLGVEPSRAISGACRVSNAVASRPPRPLKSGAGAVIRTLCASFGGWLLSQEHPGLAEGGGIEPHWLFTSPPLSRRLGDHSPAPSVLLNLVLEERFELSRPGAPVSETGVHTNSTTPAWSTDPDSNRIRAGLQSAASTASASGAQKNYKQTLAGEEGLEPSNARVRAECSGRCATPQHAVWLRDSVSSRALQGFNLALSPD